MSLANAFLLALSLKIGSALAAALLANPYTSLQTWLLGFIFPLCVMICYMIWGHHKTKDKPLEERLSYGDSCYYLGFLFTVASIILALYVLGSQDNLSTSELAIRFAAAMVTTLLGMAVRVYLVTFAKRRADVTPTDDTKPVEIQPGDGMEVRIEANLQNLGLLNKSLANNLIATEKLRVEFEHLIAKVQSDLEQMTKDSEEFTKSLLARTKQLIKASHAAFEKAMTAGVEKTTEQMAALIQSNTENTKQYISEAVKGLTAASEESISSVRQTSAASLEVIKSSGEQIAGQLAGTVSSLSEASVNFKNSLNAELENTAARMETLVRNNSEATEQYIRSAVAELSEASRQSVEKLQETSAASLQVIKASGETIARELGSSVSGLERASGEFASKLSNATVPTEAWRASLDDVSKRMNGVVDELSQKSQALVTAAETLSQSTQRISSTLNEEINVVHSGVEAGLSRIKASMTEFERNAEQAAQNLRRPVAAPAAHKEHKGLLQRLFNKAE